MADGTRGAGLLAEPNDPPRLDHDAASAYTHARHLPRAAAAGTPRRLRADGGRDGAARGTAAARPHR